MAQNQAGMAHNQAGMAHNQAGMVQCAGGSETQARRGRKPGGDASQAETRARHDGSRGIEECDLAEELALAHHPVQHRARGAWAATRGGRRREAAGDCLGQGRHNGGEQGKWDRQTAARCPLRNTHPARAPRTSVPITERPGSLSLSIRESLLTSQPQMRARSVGVRVGSWESPWVPRPSKSTSNAQPSPQM